MADCNERRRGTVRTLLALGDSFHTQGFHSRESTLFKQLVP